MYKTKTYKYKKVPRCLKIPYLKNFIILTHIFQISLSTGIVPDCLRHAVRVIAPVYKKRPKCKLSNYRRMCLRCIVSKPMNHILVSNITSYFDGHDMLNQNQHCFMSNHSCETQFISSTQENHDSLEPQRNIIVIYFR